MSDTEAANAEENEDQSMEEILQSIRRIITEDEDETAEAPAEEATESDEEAAPEEESAEDESAVEATEDEDEPSDSDVLELTEVIEEADVAEMEEEITEAVEAEQATEDVLSDIDAALSEAKQEAPVAPVKKPAASDDSLLSDNTAATAAAIFQEIKEASSAHEGSGLATRGGTTIEDLTIEAMRPMLKEWLDEHLPGVVERVVQKEIKKLTE